MNKYVPSIFTGIRLALIPVVVAFFFLSFPDHYAWSFAVFVIAMITDVIDGRLARGFNIVTKLGAFLDPLSDKIMINVMLFACASVGVVPFWLAAVLFARDLISSDFKSFAASHKIHIAHPLIEGKAKAFFETIAIFSAYVVLEWHVVSFFQSLTFWLLIIALAIGLKGLWRMLSTQWRAVLE